MELVVSWCVSVTDGESGELWALDGIPRRWMVQGQDGGHSRKKTGSDLPQQTSISGSLSVPLNHSLPMFPEENRPESARTTPLGASLQVG